jgi:hypothetical protein
MTTQPQLITHANADEFVKIYYDSKQLKINSSEFGKYILQFNKSSSATGAETKNVLDNLGNIFWAIRLLENAGGKYDLDDVEFHTKNNPIFAEINTEDYCEDDGDEEKNDSDSPTHPNQVGLLRKALMRFYPNLYLRI